LHKREKRQFKKGGKERNGTLTGQRRKTTKSSARCAKNRENRSTRRLSISSSCLIYIGKKQRRRENQTEATQKRSHEEFTLIDTRTALTDASIRHFSLSERATVKGFNNNSLFTLKQEERGKAEKMKKRRRKREEKKERKRKDKRKSKRRKRTKRR
jgi:hypothetical protein